MIRYSISENDLIAKINSINGTWFTRATQRTQEFRRRGRYEDLKDFWGDIKRAFMELQYSKCVYCERRLASKRFGSIEHDIEHFRPKSPVKFWPSPAIRRDRNINYNFTFGTPFSEGYYLLAYSIFNYATACKTCNSSLKSNYFPTLAAGGPQADHPSQLTNERHMLIYPINNIDEDPETLITFNGIIPIPVYKRGYKHRRAVVTIDFFELDIREELLRERAGSIIKIFPILENLAHNRYPAQREQMERIVEFLTSPKSEHTNCCRAFRRTYQEDPARAQKIYREVNHYLLSI